MEAFAERELGTFERAQTLVGRIATLNAVVVLRLLAGPSSQVLTQALTLLQRRHPLLRARIEPRGRRLFFTPGVGATAFRQLPRQDDSQWQAVAAAELDTPFAFSAGPLWRCTYLVAPDQPTSELLLTFHHAVMDATSGLALCQELLSLSAALAAQGVDASPGTRQLDEGDWQPKEDALPLLPATEALLPARFRGWRRFLPLGSFLVRQLGAAIADRFQGCAMKDAQQRTARLRAGARPACRVLTREFSPALSHDLVRCARRERVTLNHALNALLVLVVHRRRASPAPCWRHFNFVNLRPYLEPPVGPESLGSCFAMLRLKVQLPQPAGPLAPEQVWTLARQLQAHSQTAIRRGEPFVALHLSAALMQLLARVPHLRMGESALSYTGALPLVETYGPTELRALHAFVSNWAMGPLFTAQVRMFRARLWWDFLYLDLDWGPEPAQQLADDLETLAQATVTPPVS